MPIVGKSIRQESDSPYCATRSDANDVDATPVPLSGDPSLVRLTLKDLPFRPPLLAKRVRIRCAGDRRAIRVRIYICYLRAGLTEHFPLPALSAARPTLAFAGNNRFNLPPFTSPSCFPAGVRRLGLRRVMREAHLRMSSPISTGQSVG